MPGSRGNPTRLTSLVGKGRTVERTRPAREGGARDAKLVRTQRCGLCDDEAQAGTSGVKVAQVISKRLREKV